MSLSKELLDLIACPICKEDLKESKDGMFLICEKCQVKYPVKDGIPVLLIEEKIDLKENE